MTFDLYSSQTPQSPDCRTSKNAQETLRFQKKIVQKIPPGGGKPLLAHSLYLQHIYQLYNRFFIFFYLPRFKKYNIVFYHAVRSAILATAWLLVFS